MSSIGLKLHYLKNVKRLHYDENNNNLATTVDVSAILSLSLPKFVLPEAHVGMCAAKLHDPIVIKDSDNF
jgi:hypothetical protein